MYADISAHDLYSFSLLMKKGACLCRAAPIHTTYRGYDIYSNPSTTRGGLEVLMGLNLLEGWDIGSYGDPNHPMVLHLQVKINPMLSKTYIKHSDAKPG